MALKWYVARTRPLAEYTTRYNLEAAGVEVFLPCSPSRSPRPGHGDSPLFPGYLFLRHDLEGEGTGILNRLPQPVRLVAFGEVVPPVPDEVVAGLVRRVEAIGGSGGLWTRFRAGDVVRVTLGSDENLAEVLEETKSSRARVRVLLEFLGRLVEAEVPWWDVQPVGAHSQLWNEHGRPPRRTRGRGRRIRAATPVPAAG